MFSSKVRGKRDSTRQGSSDTELHCIAVITTVPMNG